MPLKEWQVPLQRDMEEKLKQHNVVLNALPTGAGKTYLVAETAVRAPRDMKLFVICPKSVITAWLRVLEEFGVKDRTLGVINWEKLQTGRTPFYKNGAWQLPAGTTVVIDEAHKGASGPKTITSKMMGQLKAYRFPVIIQSATLADSPLKLRAAGYLLGLHEFNPTSYYNWCRRNGCYASPFHSGLEFPKGKRGAELMAKVHEAIKDKMVRCSLDDIPGFPECEIQANLYDLDAEYTKDINEIYASLDAKLKEPNANEMVELLRARQRVELYKVPLLTDLVTEELDEGRSVVVFVSFRDTLAKLRESLRAVETESVAIYGGQSTEERDAGIKAFQSDLVRVMVAMSPAGGVGISLQAVGDLAPRTALLCPDYNAVTMKQALGRIHRVGGKKALQIFVLAAGTVEERVKRAIDRKLNNIDALNDGDLT